MLSAFAVHISKFASVAVRAVLRSRPKEHAAIKRGKQIAPGPAASELHVALP
jgi:hypothetical protein